MNKLSENRLIDRKNKLVMARGDWGWWLGEKGEGMK